MSEAAIITSNPLDGDRVAGSVGYPLPGVELRIGGGEETGVIEIRGPSVFSAYWRMPEKTAEEFTADGYFITGDVGRRDPDGRVWISGRAKDLIISGGYNVYPKEIELLLDEQAGVTESAVIGVPHPDFGQVVDIADGPALKAFVEGAAAALGGIDVLVSNASALVQGNAEDAWKAMYDIDMMGAVRSFEAARPYMEAAAQQSGDAAFVITSS